MHTFLNVRNLSFKIENKNILSNISFRLDSGNIAALLGPSGCGKTSLLRLIAGFSPPNSGEIALNGKVISTPQGVLPPEKRNIGMVFQDYALFPHLSVFENIIFGIKKNNKQSILRRVQELLDLVGLPGVEKRFPHELSGGQQQRIAIARAVAPKPQLLLLDEPFASLDTNLRERLVKDLRTLLKELNMATILVTHDQQEAFAVSEHVGLINEGKILQWDAPFNIYHKPFDPFVANFVGQGVLIKSVVISEHAVDSALGVVQSSQPLRKKIGDKLCMLVRPEDIVEDKTSSLQATITHKFFHGASTLYELNFKGIKLVASVNSHSNYPIGAQMPFAIKADHLVTFNQYWEHCTC